MARFPAVGGVFGPYRLPVKAVQHVRKMRGGAQAHLMRASDGFLYVVKFQNNPQHLRVLANDYFATKLAEQIGLPVPAVDIVEVSEWLVEYSPGLRIEMAGQILPCAAGLQFGSRYVIDPLEGRIFDYLPETYLTRIRNVQDFAGVLALDKWACNANGRQAAFWKKNRDKKYQATFIDQGYCFNAGEWTWPDSPLRGVYLRNDVYLGVRGWESFEPWLTNLERMSADRIWACLEGLPPSWYDNDLDALEKLVEDLDRRRPKVRMLIDDFRKSTRTPFVNWGIKESRTREVELLNVMQPGEA
jgi:hypothetical protein